MSVVSFKMDIKSIVRRSRHSRSASQESVLWLASPAVTVEVGEDPRIFQVHEAILCTSSKYFQKILNPEWTFNKEENMTISLTDPDDDPEAFMIYIFWLYYKNLPETVTGKPSEEQMSRLCDAYLLGEKLEDIIFKNAILAAFIRGFCHSPRTERIFPVALDYNSIYRRTTSSSRLRKLLVDTWVYVAYDDKGSGWTDYVENLPKEFLVDVTKAMIQKRPPPPDQRPWEMPEHQYFEKDDIV